MQMLALGKANRSYRLSTPIPNRIYLTLATGRWPSIIGPHPFPERLQRLCVSGIDRFFRVSQSTDHQTKLREGFGNFCILASQTA